MISSTSLFVENLSTESLPMDELMVLIGRDPNVPLPPTPSPPAPPTPFPLLVPVTRKLSLRSKPPSKIDLPTPPHISLTSFSPSPSGSSTSKPVASPLSPKILGWNFLKKNTGLHSSPSAFQHSPAGETGGSGSRGMKGGMMPPRRSMALPERSSPFLDEPSKLGESSGSATPIRPVRPGQSRSSTWTDNVPTIRSLHASLDAELPVSSPTHLHPGAPTVPSHDASTPLSLAVPLTVLPKDNARGGKFGLFVRRGSVSPRQERHGFFTGFGASGDVMLDKKSEKRRTEKEKEKQRLKLKKETTNTSSTSSGSSSMDKNKKKHSVFPPSVSFASASPTAESKDPWAPNAEEGRHTALTTASPPPMSTSTSASLFHPAAELHQIPIPLTRTISPRSPRPSSPTSIYRTISNLLPSSLSTSPSASSPLKTQAKPSLEMIHKHVFLGHDHTPFPPAFSPSFGSNRLSTSLSARSSSSRRLSGSESDEEFPFRARREQRTSVSSQGNSNPLPDQHRFSAHKRPIASVPRDRSSSPLRNELGGNGRSSFSTRRSTHDELEGGEEETAVSASPSKAFWWRPSTGRNSPSQSQPSVEPVNVERPRRRSLFGSSSMFFNNGGSPKTRTRRASETSSLRSSGLSALVVADESLPLVQQRGFEVMSRNSHHPFPSSQPSQPEDGYSPLTPPDSTVSTHPPALPRPSSPYISSFELTAPSSPTTPIPARPIAVTFEASSNLTASRPTIITNLSGSSVRVPPRTKAWSPPTKKAPKPPLTPPLSASDLRVAEETTSSSGQEEEEEDASTGPSSLASSTTGLDKSEEEGEGGRRERVEGVEHVGSGRCVLGAPLT